MQIETPQILDNKSTGGKTMVFIILALAVTGGMLYWQYRKGDESPEQ